MQYAKRIVTGPARLAAVLLMVAEMGLRSLAHDAAGAPSVTRAVERQIPEEVAEQARAVRVQVRRCWPLLLDGDRDRMREVACHVAEEDPRAR